MIPIDIRDYLGNDWMPMCNNSGDTMEHTGNIYIPDGDMYVAYATYKYIGKECPDIREVLINKTKFSMPIDKLNEALRQYRLGASYCVPNSYTDSYENYMKLVINESIYKNSF
jgi:hypothetical protein